MCKSILYFITLVILFPIFGCQKFQKNSINIDSNSYISRFELFQENPVNDNSIRITSERAVIDPLENDIQIYDSSIEILNKNSKDIKVLSGNSTLNNSKNIIRVFNNVNISLLESKNYYMTTQSLTLDLNTSFINLDKPLDINFDDSLISSSNGSYNIKESILDLNNNIFRRSIYNKDGEELYNVKVISDLGRWLKQDNSLEFSSKDNQVETTINFLRIK